MRVYIDFDRTLFDCDSFLSDFYAIINKYQIPKDVFKSCQIQCKKEGFNPRLILDSVYEDYTFDMDIYHEVDDLLHRTNDYLYSDTISFLKYLKSCEYEIIILTKGNDEYQKEKILNAQIDEYYDELIVTMKHKGKLNLDYENGIFIDDNPFEIIDILKKNPKKIIRIKRNGTKYNDVEISESIDSVSSLDDIVKNKLL